MVTTQKETMTRVISQVDVLQKIQQVIEKQTVFVSVGDIVGTKQLHHQQGMKLAQHVIPLLQRKCKVSISLQGIFMLHPGFVQEFYVCLYQHLPIHAVAQNLTLTHLQSGDDLTVETAIRNAKLCVFHRDIYETAMRHTLEWAVDMGYLDDDCLRDGDEEDTYNEEKKEDF